MSIPKEAFRTYDVTALKGVIRVAENTYVWCDRGDPKQAIFFTGRNGSSFSLQGNSDIHIADRLRPPFPDAELVFLEKVFIPWHD